MNSVAVIGAGITGLTAAFYLQRKGIPVTVYEASGRVGGVIQSLRRDGYLAEFGPNTILETSPKIGQLIHDAGLESRKVIPDAKAETRYLVRYKRPIEMPAKPLGFFTTPLFSAGAKFAVLREPFIKPRRDGVEESIAEFTVRRFNQEFLDHAIDALVGGIYAGDPHKLSVTHAFPRLKALEDKYGSMIKGQLFGARDRKKSGEISRDRAPKFSFDEGLQVLPETLRDRLGEAVKLNTPVTQLTQTETGWRISTSTGDHDHTAVIYCGTASKLATLEIIVKGQTLDLSPLSEIRHPPVACVVLGFRREDVTHPCEGFGMLIPKAAGFKILGTIFSTSLFPGRAPAGHLMLTSFIGGERYPELASLPHEKLVALACEDLRVILGVRGQPTFSHSVFYPKAIPQYNVGYGRFRDLMTEIETKAPGLYFAGHYRDGISVSDSILSGCNIADRVSACLDKRIT
ncbi:MAG TPA: protoporphyrinogen oxidase [Verrucomicrobiae bacterium]|nr:protoporphyrinogen oxidase [Verrucomicrobiae bacterium]